MHMDRIEPIISNEPYHVYNRGNNRQTIFPLSSDYEVFLRKLTATAAKNSVTFVAYVLMPNHYHLLLIQQSGGSIPDMMEALGTSTAKRFNAKYGHVGHLFQGPYRYALVTTTVGIAEVARYIHLNPVRAGLAKLPEEWEWSDFRRYAGVEGFLDQRENKVQGNLLLGNNYAEFVRQGVDDIESVRRLLFAD